MLQPARRVAAYVVDLRAAALRWKVFSVCRWNEAAVALKRLRAPRCSSSVLPLVLCALMAPLLPEMSGTRDGVPCRQLLEREQE